MIMYRVSNECNSIQFTEHEIIKQTEVFVFYMNGKYKQREQKVKSKTVWFESKEKALGKAKEWAIELVSTKRNEFKFAIESYGDIIKLGKSK